MVVEAHTPSRPKAEDHAGYENLRGADGLAPHGCLHNYPLGAAAVVVDRPEAGCPYVLERQPVLISNRGEVGALIVQGHGQAGQAFIIDKENGPPASTKAQHTVPLLRIEVGCRLLIKLIQKGVKLFRVHGRSSFMCETLPSAESNAEGSAWGCGHGPTGDDQETLGRASALLMTDDGG